jgi:hypothetical protein
MKLAVIVCANGLGHLKRSMRIVSRLADRISDLRVALFCEPWQLEILKGWRHRWQASGVTPVAASLPVRWDPDREYYGEWLLHWHAAMSTWNLADFDHVLSDNLVEPLVYADRVTLSGSFLWHDVLASAFPESSDVGNYRSWCEDVLLSSRPKMVVNRYFAMPATGEQTEVREVGLIHFRPDLDAKRTNLLPGRVLIALGHARLAHDAVDQLFAAIAGLQTAGVRVLALPPWFEMLSERCRGLERYDWSGDNLSTVDLAIIRGGLGTISDCIAARIPMLYLNDPSPEIKFNQARLCQMGIGLPLEKVLDGGSPLLTEAAAYAGMRARMDGFALAGEIEASEVLAKLWGLA